jgi:hypothetical protein
MDGEKFRARAREYIAAAGATADPVCKAALMDLAHRWLRLAAQIDGSLCREPLVVVEPSTLLHKHNAA